MSNSWIFFVSKRFSRIDRKGRSAATSFLATAGICFGVMTLIVVMSVMNGFQLSFIDSILELSSYHIQIENLDSDKEKLLYLQTENIKKIRSITPFYEAQTLMTGDDGKESAAIIRAVPSDIYTKDFGFNKEMNMIKGSFDLESKNSIVLGSSLARSIGAKTGSIVTMFVLSGGNDVEMISDDRRFVVTGVFSSGYSEINSSYCFINIDSAEEYFGKKSIKHYGIKIEKSDQDLRIINELKKQGIDGAKSWREYNKNFYSTLKIEKNMLMLLVLLIFLVVAINIYNGMRRLVLERSSEIAIFSSFGASQSEIKTIFILRGFITGATGAIVGVILGLLISCNTDVVFNAASKIVFMFQYVLTSITNPENLQYVAENSSYGLYASIPARIFIGEVFFIALFGIMAPLLASWAASANVLKLKIAEVLHE